MKEGDFVGTRKVTVVGAGAVGSTFCYSLAQSGLADEIALVDRNDDLLRGQVLDLSHGKPFFPTVDIRAGTPEDYSDSQVVVITAGAAQRPGETRLQLLKKNSGIVNSIVREIAEQDSDAVVVVVTNPVDVLTQIAIRASDWPRGRIIGSGTVLDSARFRYLLSQHCGVDVHNVHAYILGEHGDSEFAAWSMTHIAGMPIDEYCPVCGRCEDWDKERKAIEEQVRDSAYHIIGYKGATNFGVGQALLRIVGTILRGQRSVLTVSTTLEGEFGLDDVCLSVPSLLSSRGVDRIIESRLSNREQELLENSAAVLKNAVTELEQGI